MTTSPKDIPAGSRPGSITIARHGRPQANREQWLDWRGYETWWDDHYQPAGLVAGQEAPAELQAAAQEAHTVFASSLRRAIETAAAVAPGREVIVDPVFIEAELPPPPPLPGRYMAKTWGVFARCSWWLGAARGRESRADAEQRAGQAAQHLIAAAAAGPVVLCAHGWFNRMMRPHLRSAGWSCVHDGGDTYWSWRRYEYTSR